MTDAEIFFLECVSNGEIIVTEIGVIIHVSTGKDSWATGSGGYPKISKMDRMARVIRHIQCHRLVWLALRGPIPEAKQINHKNGDKSVYHVSNLELTTASQNMRHAIENGLLVGRSGVENGFSKFTREDVSTMKWMFLQGSKVAQIARHYEVHRVTINDIVKQRRYAEIPAQPPSLQ